MAGESLRVIEGRVRGKEIPLDLEFLIGRASEGDGRLGDDPEISRHHARITRRAGDQLTIEDLGSTNGTRVNSKLITEPQVLMPGDTIRVGMTTLQVLDSAGNAPQITALAATRPQPSEQPTRFVARPTPASPEPRRRR